MLTSGDLKSGDFLSNTININPPKNKFTQSSNFNMGVTQDIIHSLTWNTDHPKSLLDDLSLMKYMQKLTQKL